MANITMGELHGALTPSFQYLMQNHSFNFICATAAVVNET